MTRTRQISLCATALFLILTSARGQIWVHSPMPGVNASRDSHYSDLDEFGPPFELVETDHFLVSSITGIFPAEHGFLVTSGEGSYKFYTPSGQYSGQAHLSWSTVAPAYSCAPAYSRGIVILESATTTSVQAVGIHDGKALWTGPGVGEEVYPPVVSGDTVFYHGSDRVLAVRLRDGGMLWEYRPIGGLTNATPALADGLLFVIDRAGTLHALAAATGQEAWSRTDAGADGSTIIAARDLVFVSRYSRITAFGTNNGSGRWSQDFPTSIAFMAFFTRT